MRLDMTVSVRRQSEIRYHGWNERTTCQHEETNDDNRMRRGKLAEELKDGIERRAKRAKRKPAKEDGNKAK